MNHPPAPGASVMNASARTALRRWAAKVPPAVIAWALGLLSFLALMPGVMSSDSADQLGEARTGDVSDWHSPLLVQMWRLLLPLGDAGTTMLALQHALFWAGASLLAASLTRTGRRLQAWAVLAVCLLPHFVFFNRYILKDTAHYSAMFLCAALLFAAVSSPPERVLRNLMLAVFACAVLVPIRINGAFAVAGLTVVLLLPRIKVTLWRVWLGVMVVSLLLVMFSRWINTEVLRARSSDVIQSLQIHDLMGIQYHSRDASVWGPYALSNEEVDNCYTAYHWDIMGPTGVCAGMRQRIGASNGRQFPPEAVNQRGALWLKAISAHPVAYARHRLRQFNSATYFVVPAFHVRFSKSIRDGRKEGTEPITPADVRLDYVKKNFLLWPATWLAGGLGALLLLWPRMRETASAHFGVALLASGLAYGLAYLVIGVATDVRYFLWTQLSIALALVVAWPDFCASWQKHDWRRAFAVAGVIGVVVIGLGARLANVPFV